jgi:hypothetical protein
MLAHFMLFSEADIEYRFLLATNEIIKSDSNTPLGSLDHSNAKSMMSRFHKVSLGLVNAKNRKGKK